MKLIISSALVAAAFVAEYANAQTAQALAQCGGQDFTGLTACDEGYECKFQNDYYSQCVPSGDEPAPTEEPSDSLSTESNPVVEDNSESNSAVEDSSESNTAVQDNSESSSESNPVVADSSDSNLVVEDSSDSNPVVEENSDSNPVVEENSEANAVVEENSESNAVVEDSSDSNPVVEETTESIPIVEVSTGSSLEATTVTKSAGCGKAAGIASGTFSITINGKNRQYIVRVPQNYNSNTAYKLIFALHWRGGSMNDAAAIEGGYYGLQALAKESAIFVALNGLNQGWANSGGEDVLLVDAILNKIQSSLCVDTTKVFSTGFSYGAGMSYALACARPDKLRAVALYAGAQLSGCAGGTKPIAFWSTHGVHDSALPIASGRALRDHFLQVNGCQSKTAPEPANGQAHTKTVYTCKAGFPVQFYTHTGDHVADPKDPGQFSSWAPAEVWSFFSQFS